MTKQSPSVLGDGEIASLPLVARNDVLRRGLAVALSLEMLVSGIPPEAFAKGKKPPAPESVAPAGESFGEKSVPTIETQPPPFSASVTPSSTREAPVGEALPVRTKELELAEGPKVTLDLKNAELEAILRVLSEQTGANFITNEAIRKRRLSAYLKQVSLEDALTALLDVNGLAYERIGDSNIYAIKTRSQTRPRVVTRIYTLKHVQLSLTDEKSGSLPGVFGTTGGQSLIQTPSNPSISIQTGGPGSTQPGSFEGKDGAKAFPSGIMRVLSTVLSEFGKVEVDPRTNSIAVTDLPDRFPLVESVIRKLDVKAPQVMIQVEVVEADADSVTRLGLEYGGSNGELARFVGPARLTDFPFVAPGRVLQGTRNFAGQDADVTGTFPGINSLTSSNNPKSTFLGILSLQEFSVVLRALVTKAKARFLARPKILTLNNRQAEINITANTAVGIQSATVTQTGLLVSTAERQLTGVILKVTPQVNEDNYVTMQIEPSVTRPQASRFFPQQFVDPQSRGLRTTIRVKAGETVLIGGLISDESQRSVRKVPFLGSIPLIGAFFTGLSTSRSKSELLIFITPEVVSA